jgi:hypothetical protein
MFYSLEFLSWIQREGPNFFMEPLSMTTALIGLTMTIRSLLNLLERKGAAWNWVVKDQSLIQTAGRGDGIIMSIGASIIRSV